MDKFLQISHDRITWFHSPAPLNAAQCQELSDKYGFHAHHVNSTQKGRTPRPKISSNKKYTHLVFHLPYRPTNSSKLFVCELNVFITRSRLFTIESVGNLEALNQYFQTTSASKRLAKSRLSQGPAVVFLKFMSQVLEDLEKEIDHQGTIIDTLNREIFTNRLARQFIESISLLRYNQVLALTSLERQSRLLDNFWEDKNPLKRFSPNTTYRWHSLIEIFQTLTYELQSDRDHLEGLVKTFESLVTFRTNETIKVLTVFSVILLPITAISGIFGMNFQVIPLSSHPFGFFFIILMMILLAVTMTFIFKYKRWL